MVQERRGNRGSIEQFFFVSDAMKDSQSFRLPVNLVFLAT